MRPVLVLAVLMLSAVLPENRGTGQTRTPVLKAMSWLSRYNLQDPRPKQFRLPKQLSEASGLAFSDDGRLFCHDDERAVVYQLDYTTGKILKQFSFGSFGLRGDFEDIAVKGETMYIVSSNGIIHEFKEGGNGERVPSNTHKTFLNIRNDVEGLVYDRGTDCLLLACKADPGRGYAGNKAVYAFSLKSKKLNTTPRLLIPLKSVAKKAHRGQFNPSGITMHPKSGTFFIISANGRSIIEMMADGTILDQREIPNKVNKQPEGIAFADDLTMILCNDGQGGTGVLTVYLPSPPYP